MGAVGSGRKQERQYLGQLPYLDIGAFKPHLSNEGAKGRLTWDNGGSAAFTVGKDALLVEFDAAGAPVAQWIEIKRTGCAYGGSRPWLACKCGNRAGKLFLATAMQFVCHRCSHSAYQSKSYSPLSMWGQVIRRLQGKLASERGKTPPTKCDTLKARLAEAQAKRDKLLQQKLDKALARFKPKESR